MKNYEIKEVETLEGLKFLHDNWAMTWEGLREEDFQIACNECGTSETIGYLVKGRTMNKLCHLTGSNAYPENLNIFAIYPFHGLAINYGARWMYDIINSNSHRENGYMPF